mmetsp:Transcript_30958/g.55610  ORF Transcript_30958/g.55610 Transcript_30958/m.55610 type:complete len:249 (-) Transcript_30958:7001-7747(-)
MFTSAMASSPEFMANSIRRALAKLIPANMAKYSINSSSSSVNLPPAPSLLMSCATATTSPARITGNARMERVLKFSRLSISWLNRGSAYGSPMFSGSFVRTTSPAMPSVILNRISLSMLRAILEYSWLCSRSTQKRVHRSASSSCWAPVMIVLMMPSTFRRSEELSCFSISTSMSFLRFCDSSNECSRPLRSEVPAKSQYTRNASMSGSLPAFRMWTATPTTSPIAMMGQQIKLSSAQPPMAWSTSGS